MEMTVSVCTTRKNKHSCSVPGEMHAPSPLESYGQSERKNSVRPTRIQMTCTRKALLLQPSDIFSTRLCIVLLRPGEYASGVDAAAAAAVTTSSLPPLLLESNNRAAALLIQKINHQKEAIFSFNFACNAERCPAAAETAAAVVVAVAVAVAQEYLRVCIYSREGAVKPTGNASVRVRAIFFLLCIYSSCSNASIIYMASGHVIVRLYLMPQCVRCSDRPSLHQILQHNFVPYTCSMKRYTAARSRGIAVHALRSCRRYSVCDGHGGTLARKLNARPLPQFHSRIVLASLINCEKHPGLDSSEVRTFFFSISSTAPEVRATRKYSAKLAQVGQQNWLPRKGLRSAPVCEMKSACVSSVCVVCTGVLGGKGTIKCSRCAVRVHRACLPDPTLKSYTCAACFSSPSPASTASTGSTAPRVVKTRRDQIAAVSPSDRRPLSAKRSRSSPPSVSVEKVLKMSRANTKLPNDESNAPAWFKAYEKRINETLTERFNAVTGRIDSLDVRFGALDSRFDGLVAQQTEQQRLIAENSRDIKELDQRTATEVADLRGQLANSSNEITALRSDLNSAAAAFHPVTAAHLDLLSSADPCEVRIAGIPPSVVTDDFVTAESVLRALQLERLASHILRVRAWSPRTRASAEPGAVPVSTVSAGRTIVVCLASAGARDMLLAAAPRLRLLTLGAIFGIAEGGPDRLRMTAILPGPLYGLFKKCQTTSRTLHYAPPVVRSLRIFMRQTRDSPLIPITCEADLGRLKPHSS
ncbi:unnamed protein product [Trichogramma brassicae]|uniref:Phorbol-ester/DAG-type domain-containing protein n=1 Tax=Trichogramma brassicae TaxID=86971 RepID=A0A6H5I9E4_9HYME|nr:unnamed protein product [Trichogramma brassicae]